MSFYQFKLDFANARCRGHGLLHSRLCWAGGEARQAKGRFQKCEWTNKCKLSVSISLVNFHGKFALKFEMTEFYESLLHSLRANGQA